MMPEDMLRVKKHHPIMNWDTKKNNVYWQWFIAPIHLIWSSNATASSPIDLYAVFVKHWTISIFHCSKFCVLIKKSAAAKFNGKTDNGFYRKYRAKDVENKPKIDDIVI